jgi:hypothetical protein
MDTRLLGPITSVALAIGKMAYRQYRAYRDTAKLVRSWAAYNYAGRELVPMAGSSVTIISASFPWSYTLKVYGRDFLNGILREHDGQLELDPTSPNRGVRTVVYRDSGERTRQQVEVVGDGRMLVIYPTEPGYLKHALLPAGLLGAYQ